MDILSRRLYNGGFNHLRRRTGSLIVRIPRTIVQPPLVRPMSTPHNAPLMNANVRGHLPGLLAVSHLALSRYRMISIGRSRLSHAVVNSSARFHLPMCISHTIAITARELHLLVLLI